MRWKTRFLFWVLAVFAALSCTGCMMADVDTLFSLPKLPDGYLRLQTLLDAETAKGSAYAAPTGGTWRQSVQQVDLDGDGRAEALAFFTDKTGTPKICIYKPDDQGGYTDYAVISGEGTAIGGVDYADLNGDGQSEIAVAWQTSAKLTLLSVYSLSDGEPKTLLSADCTNFVLTDLDGDGVSELLALRAEGAVDMYTFSVGGDVFRSTAPLSGSIESLQRARTGTLSDGMAAFFVESSLTDGSCVTDVYVVRDGALTHLTPDASPRACEVWATDIDADRCLEVPETEQMGDSGYYFLRWYALDSQGGRSLRRITFHCFDDGWYLTFTQEDTVNLTVRRDEGISGQYSMIFSSQGEDGTWTERAEICVFSGDNRRELAQEDGFFILREGVGIVYAARILDDSISRESVEDHFYLIYSEWQTGAL